ncbi:hypothetical protein [Caproiciproducens sp.]|uniref:hypothetical protein n=1 Tax=Caproiciproducens sp. TaxID=1954376 RepID=UPI00289EFB2F|nr:hypothetical protein [Caproiciproducens sp.]
MARGKRPILKADPAVALQFKQEQARKDIVEITEWLKDVRIEIYQRTIKTGKLIQAYKIIGDTENMCKTAQELISLVNVQSYKISKITDKKHANAILNHYHQAYIELAPYRFHHFLVCMEWNYPPEMKFYANRKCVMEDWAREIERLEFGELDLLGLSAPPRSGKTGLGELALAWMIGRHPDKSILFATHTNAMARKAMTDVYNLITEPRRGWGDIFQNFTVNKSQEDLWIDLEPKDSSNTYKTIYFRGIDGSFAGILEASWLIYCDDLINGIIEATNPDRLANAWQKYGTDISQRRVDDNVKELHIATRWSTKDVLSQLEEENEDNPRASFIKVPGLNENGESNFMFPYRPMTKEHFEKLRNKMDEVSFECIVQQHPVERDGLVFPESGLLTEDVPPDGEPDRICFACDVAWGGGDYLSMPIGKVYGMDVYIDDVVHSPADKYTTKPLVVAAIINNGASAGFFEWNNGGDEYMDDIIKMLREKGYRCNITGERAPTNKSKLDRILACAPEIKGTILDGSGYRLHFKSKVARKGDKAYEMYMKHLTEFNQSAKYQGKQKDDAADATASLVTNVLGGSTSTGRVTTFSRSLLF